jgi:hypothetical protein
MKLVPPLNRGGRSGPAAAFDAVRPRLHSGDASVRRPCRLPRRGRAMEVWSAFTSLFWDLDAGHRRRKERHARFAGACRWVPELNVPSPCVADLRFPASGLRDRLGHDRDRPNPSELWVLVRRRVSSEVMPSHVVRRRCCSNCCSPPPLVTA